MAYINAADAKVIRQELKEAFPEFKFGVRIHHHSSVTITIKSGPVRFDPADHAQLNHYYPDHYDNADIFRRIIEIVNKKNYDNSDSQVDYFDVGFYVDFQQGTWDKPYILTAAKEDDGDDGDDELPSTAYLQDLAERLRNVPVKYGIDGYDIDRLARIASEMAYVNASDDIAAYQADQCGRQAVTVAWYYDHMDPDTPAWRFDEEAYKFGLECWRTVEPDRSVDGDSFFLTWSSETPVPGDTRIFVQKRDLLLCLRQWRPLFPHLSRWQFLKLGFRCLKRIMSTENS